MSVRICYLHRNLHEDLPNCLFIYRGQQYTYMILRGRGPQPRFYALNSDKGQIQELKKYGIHSDET